MEKKIQRNCGGMQCAVNLKLGTAIKYGNYVLNCIFIIHTTVRHCIFFRREIDWLIFCFRELSLSALIEWIGARRTREKKILLDSWEAKVNEDPNSWSTMKDIEKRQKTLKT